MKKASTNISAKDIRPEYDLATLKGGVRGKYYEQARTGSNLVLIAPELANVFPDTASVNRASPAGGHSRGGRCTRQATRVVELLLRRAWIRT
jgi:hypothetical protein